MPSGTPNKIKIKGTALNSQFIQSLNCNATNKSVKQGTLKDLYFLVERNTDTVHNTIEEMHPMMLITKANAEDNPRWHESMNSSYKDEWWRASK